MTVTALTIVNTKNLDELRELMGSNFRSLIEEYIHSSEEMIRDIRSYICNQNAEDLSRTSHKLKSQSKQVGAIRVAELAFTLERNAAKLSASDLTKLYEQLHSEFESTRSFLEEEIA